MATDLNKVKQSLGLAIYQALNVRPDKDPRRDLQTGAKLWIRAAGPMVDYLYASGVRSWNLTLQQVTDNGSYTNHRIQVDASGSRFYDLSITSGSLEMFNHKIIHLTDPTNLQDAATKNYVDIASGSCAQSLQGVTNIGNTTTKDITAANLKSNANVYINNDGVDGDSFVYFYENSSPTGASLMWDDSEDSFVFSDGLHIPGTLRLKGHDETWTTGGWGKSLEFENDRVFMWKKGAGAYSWGMGGASDSNWYLIKSTADDASQAGTAIMKIEGGTNIVSYTGRLRTGSHLSINYDGPDGDSYIYFYDNNSETGEYLKWDESDHSFEFSDDLFVVNLFSREHVYINHDGGEGDSFLYFYENGSAQGASLMWDDSEDSFALSDGININGTTRILSTDEDFTNAGWGKALEFENSDALMWKKGAGSYSWGMGAAADGNWYFAKSIADDASQDGTAVIIVEGATGIVMFPGGLKAGDGGITNYTEIKADGEIELHGTARVIKHIRVAAPQWTLGATAPITAIKGITPTLGFDKSTDDSVHFSIIVPQSMESGSAINVVVDWLYVGSQDNGTVCWGLQYDSYEAGDLVVDIGGPIITETSAGNHVTERMVRTEFTATLDGARLHDVLALRLFRDVSEDTLDTDAYMMQVHFMCLQNKLGEAT